MIVTIDFESDRPIYEQLYRQIIEGIARRELTPGEALPSVRQLGEQLGVNMHTIHKGYQQLKDAGYVVMDRRRGAAVADPLPEAEEDWSKRRREELLFYLADGKNRGLSDEELILETKELLRCLKGGDRDE